MLSSPVRNRAGNACFAWGWARACLGDDAVLVEVHEPEAKVKLVGDRAEGHGEQKVHKLGVAQLVVPVRVDGLRCRRRGEVYGGVWRLEVW